MKSRDFYAAKRTPFPKQNFFPKLRTSGFMFHYSLPIFPVACVLFYFFYFLPSEMCYHYSFSRYFVARYAVTRFRNTLVCGRQIYFVQMGRRKV